MRRILTFECEGARLAATLDEAPGTSGLLIVSGGNEIRIGAHRGMAKLAADIAAAGYPVFRFDRRGIGDSEGENEGFSSSGPDCEAAIAAFRAECRALQNIVAFGNCDAASALVMHRPFGVDALVLANPWVIERPDELPPSAEIRARYRKRLNDPQAWLGLVSGAIDLRKLARGLWRLAFPVPAKSLTAAIANGIAAFEGPVFILAAKGDGTAIAFIEEWRKPVFAQARTKAVLTGLESASHSFASSAEYGELVRLILSALDREARRVPTSF